MGSCISLQFGESQIVARSRLPQILQAIIGYVNSGRQVILSDADFFRSLASPDSETTANSLVLVTHSAHEDLRRLEEMKISKWWYFAPGLLPRDNRNPSQYPHCRFNGI